MYAKYISYYCAMDDVDALFEMRLDFKAPANKPAFIGIRFPDWFSAGQTNKDMIDEYKGKEFSLTLAPVRDKINLKLTVDSPHRVWKYLQIKYDPGKLHLFMAIPTASWTFGHIFEHKGRDQIARTTPHNNVFSVKVRFIHVSEEGNWAGY